RRLGVDLDEKGAGLGRRGGQTRRRIDDGRSAHDEAEVAMGGALGRRNPDTLRQHLAEEDDVRPHLPAARDADGWTHVRRLFTNLFPASTLQTTCPPGVAMQFQDLA